MGISKEWISDHCIGLSLIMALECCLNFERFQYSVEALIKIERFHI